MRNVEELLSPDRRDDFLERQAAVHETADILGLQPDSAVLFGGAAMALHGLDTHTGQEVLHGAFDIEAYVTRTQLTGFPVGPLAVTVNGGTWRVQIGTEAGIPLAFTGFTGCKFGDRGYDDYEGARADSIVVGELSTLTVDTLAAMKLAAGRPKDKAGLIQAHLIGSHEGNPLIDVPSWQTVVAAAVERVREDCRPPGAGAMLEQYPEWLTTLSRSDFSHPAFEGEIFEQAA